MTRRLVETMRVILDGWQHDLPDSWRTVFAQVDLGFDGAEPTLELAHWEPVFPTRKGAELLGAPPGAHALKGFDGIEPADVSVVLVGQDPYPGVAQATGVGFEFGLLPAWRALDAEIAHPLSRVLARTLLQLLCAHRTSDAQFAGTEADWVDALRHAEREHYELPAALADRWKSNGVLMTNTALTLTRFSVEIDPHYWAHRTIWAPLLSRLFEYLTERSDRPVVIVPFGDLAQSAVRAHLAVDEAPLPSHVVVLERPHPAEGQTLLATGNIFDDCNEQLVRLGGHPIAW